MTGRLKQFLKQTKDKKEEEVRLQQEVIDKALSMVPRCELNADLPEDAPGEDLWKSVHQNFEWRFGPAKGKSLKETKTQFLKWAARKLKDPVRTICLIELMIREKKMFPITTETGSAEVESGTSLEPESGSESGKSTEPAEAPDA